MITLENINNHIKQLENAKLNETISKIALKENIIFLPGCEVESSEEIHVLCLFENVADAIKFDENTEKIYRVSAKNIDLMKY